MVKFLGENKHAISWNHYGDSGGEPVFYFHGMPGSCLEASVADEIAGNMGINLISIDRPGYGDSDRQQSLSLFDLADIVAQLADSLQLGRFSVLGFSGGGAYALACAARLSSRIKRTVLVGSIAPFETDEMQSQVNVDFKPLYELAKLDPEAAQVQISDMASNPEMLMAAMQSILPEPDQSIFAQEGFHRNYLKNLSQAILNGVEGLVDDLYRVTNPWLFDIADIESPVNIWHGRDDNNVGYGVAEYLSSKLAKTSCHLLEDAGHFFMFRDWEQVFERLAARE